jgi:hypothetical protein
LGSKQTTLDDELGGFTGWNELAPHSAARALVHALQVDVEAQNAPEQWVQTMLTFCEKQLLDTRHGHELSKRGGKNEPMFASRTSTHTPVKRSMADASLDTASVSLALYDSI